MKFACDNCRAQYMIADDKIGTRGVKVRCKKCAHVIILRPATAEAGADPGPPMTMPPPPPMEDEATLNADTSDIASSLDLGSSVSSDMGLSAEFSAAGFDDTQAASAETTDAGNRLDEVTAGFDASSVPAPPSDGSPFDASPFGGPGDGVSMGGSLDDLQEPPENTSLDGDAFGEAGLGAVPTHDDDLSEPTKVDAAPGGLAEALGTAAGMSESPNEHEVETRVGQVDVPPEAIGPGPDEADEPATAHDMTLPSELEEAAEQKPSVDLPSFDFGAKSEPAPDMDASSEDPLSSLGEGISEGLDHDFGLSESTDLGGGIFGDGETSEDGGVASEAESAPQSDGDLDGAGDISVTGVSEEDATLGAPSLDALAASADALDDASSDDNGWNPEDGLGDMDLGGLGGAEVSDDLESDSGPTAVGVTMNGAPSAKPENFDEASFENMAPTESAGPDMESEVANISDNHLHAELGSAFDAVFGDENSSDGSFNPQPGEGGPDPFSSLVESAEGALQTSGIGDSQDVDRKETRVFDQGAMQNVQDEQDLALSPEEDDAREWYVAIDEEQVGPLTVADLAEHWDMGRIDASSLGWKQGMGDWTAVAEIDELGSLLERPVVKPTIAPEDELPPIAGEVQISASRAPEPVASLPSASMSLGAALAEREPSDVSDGGWKPSAASALASLAAAELDAPAMPATDIAAGPALPATSTGSGSYDNLIDPQPRSASLFGVQENTSPSMAAPLPKAPELASSVALKRGPASGGVPSWLWPVVALCLVVIAGGVVYGLVFKDEPTTPANVPGSAVAAAPTRAEPPVAPAAAPAAPAAAGKPAPTAPEGAAPTPPGEATSAAMADGTQPALQPPSGKPAAAPGELLQPELKAPPKKKATTKKASSKKPRSRRKPKTRDEPKPKRPKPQRTSATADDLLDSEGRGGGSSVKKTLGDDDIMRVLRKNRKKIKSCITKQQKANANVEGIMTVKFVITNSGRTSQQAVKPSKFRSSVAGKCVLKSVRGWRFPKFSGRPIPLDFPVKVKGR